MYLRELKPIMMEKLLADYLHGVDIYLNVVRKQADHAVKYVGLIAVVLLIPYKCVLPFCRTFETIKNVVLLQIVKQKNKIISIKSFIFNRLSIS